MALMLVEAPLTEIWTAHRPAGGGSSIEPTSYFDFIHPTP